jgi:hypothetical protein
MSVEILALVDLWLCRDEAWNKYTARPLSEPIDHVDMGQAVRGWRLTNKQNGKEYLVRMNRDAHVTCTCDGFRSTGQCKHASKLVSMRWLDGEAFHDLSERTAELAATLRDIDAAKTAYDDAQEEIIQLRQQLTEAVTRNAELERGLAAIGKDHLASPAITGRRRRTRKQPAA